MHLLEENLNTTYLITGGTGAVGVEISKSLKKLGKNVITLGKSQFNDYIHDITYVLPNKFDNPKIDCIIHLAGVVHNKKHAYSYCAKSYFIDKRITENITEFANRNRIKSLIFFSSIAVYGKVTGKNLSEEIICEPLSSYGLSKLYSEQYFLEKLTNTKVYCLRLPLIITADKLSGNLKTLDRFISICLFFRLKKPVNDRKSYALSSLMHKTIINIDKLPTGIYNFKHGDVSFDFITSVFEKIHKKKLLKINYRLINLILKFLSLFKENVPVLIIYNLLLKVTKELTIDTSKLKFQIKCEDINSNDLEVILFSSRLKSDQ